MEKQPLPPHQKDGTGGTKTMTLADLSGKKVICKTFIAGDKMAPHQAPTDVFVLLLDGQMDISLNGTPLGEKTNGVPPGGMPPIRFVAGDYVVIPANTTHALTCMETARLLIYR